MKEANKVVGETCTSMIDLTMMIKGASSAGEKTRAPPPEAAQRLSREVAPLSKPMMESACKV